MTATFSYQYEKAYQVSSEWKTIIDEVYSGSEQRRNMWSSPRKKWVLRFSVRHSSATDILAFFNARKGRYEAFYWTWQDTHPVTGVDMGGDGVQYLVRFDMDELNLEHVFMGNQTFQITLVEVQS